MAKMVTGSVADKVAPTEMASTKLISSPSRGTRVYNHSNRPMTTADKKVPAKAKVKMVPMFRKKLPCVQPSALFPKSLLFTHSYLMQLVSASQDDRG